MFSGSAKVVAFVPLDSRHPSRPAFGVDDWGAENDGGRGESSEPLQLRHYDGFALPLQLHNISDTLILNTI